MGPEVPFADKTFAGLLCSTIVMSPPCKSAFSKRLSQLLSHFVLQLSSGVKISLKRGHYLGICKFSSCYS